MASVPTPYQTHIPLPSLSDETPLKHEAHLSEVPVHIVTHASQLPPEFLHPSSERQLVIGFDCEGVDLCRHGTLCIMQLAFPVAIYLVNAIQGGEMLVKACKPALESSYITKVIHDCKRDSEIAFSLIEEQEGRLRSPDDYISFVSLLKFVFVGIYVCMDIYVCKNYFFGMGMFIWLELFHGYGYVFHGCVERTFEVSCYQ
ncbi:uncharacterized protein LOC21397970 isoform X2 [Morus notabilis]|uniref:uncharacterized protein LOC21397970 isoform X2 n=1 Tax=Morus notabilis TaxID=981085 RepID=UPI000CED3797|nr:uncharacterized protein LOC21397970 isoform X2 [Morus notabilis]